jgi:hypothetical protein
MTSSATAQRIVRQLDGLAPDLQQQVLEFVNALALSQRKGPPGKQLLRFAGTISTGDAQAMLRAGAESCERVDADAW